MEPLTKWVRIAQKVAEIGFYSTTFFCGSLIFLTTFGVKRNFGSYKYLLILFPAVGIFFASVELMLYPNVHSFNSGFFYYTTENPFNVGIDVVAGLLAFYTSIYASTISMLSVQFVYRYWAVFDESKLIWFKGWRFLISIAYCVIVGAQWGMSHYWFDMMDEYSDAYMREEMLEKYGVNISEVARMAMIAYEQNGGIRWRNIYCVLDMSTFTFIQYSIIIYCAVEMYRKMEEKLQMLSISLRRLHRQFYKTLIVQIISPTICLFSPVLFIMYLPLFKLKVSIPTGMFLCALTLYPAMDAIIVMYIVADYKKAIKNLLENFIEKMCTVEEVPEETTDARPPGQAANKAPVN